MPKPNRGTGRIRDRKPKETTEKRENIVEKELDEAELARQKLNAVRVKELVDRLHQLTGTEYSIGMMVDENYFTRSDGTRFESTGRNKDKAEKVLEYLDKGGKLRVFQTRKPGAFEDRLYEEAQTLSLDGQGKFIRGVSHARVAEAGYFQRLYPLGQAVPKPTDQMRNFLRNLPDYLQKNMQLDIRNPQDAERLKAFYVDGRKVTERNMLTPVKFTMENGKWNLRSENDKNFSEKKTDFDYDYMMRELRRADPDPQAVIQAQMIMEAAMKGNLVAAKPGQFLNHAPRVYMDAKGNPTDRPTEHPAYTMQSVSADAIREVVEQNHGKGYVVEGRGNFENFEQFKSGIVGEVFAGFGLKLQDDYKDMGYTGKETVENIRQRMEHREKAISEKRFFEMTNPDGAEMPQSLPMEEQERRRALSNKAVSTSFEIMRITHEDMVLTEEQKKIVGELANGENIRDFPAFLFPMKTTRAEKDRIIDEIFGKPYEPPTDPKLTDQQKADHKKEWQEARTGRITKAINDRYRDLLQKADKIPDKLTDEQLVERLVEVQEVAYGLTHNDLKNRAMIEKAGIKLDQDVLDGLAKYREQKDIIIEDMSWNRLKYISNDVYQYGHEELYNNGESTIYERVEDEERDFTALERDAGRFLTETIASREVLRSVYPIRLADRASKNYPDPTKIYHLDGQPYQEGLRANKRAVQEGTVLIENQRTHELTAMDIKDAAFPAKVEKFDYKAVLNDVTKHSREEVEKAFGVNKVAQRIAAPLANPAEQELRDKTLSAQLELSLAMSETRELERKHKERLAANPDIAYEPGFWDKYNQQTKTAQEREKAAMAQLLADLTVEKSLVGKGMSAQEIRDISKSMDVDAIKLGMQDSQQSKLMMEALGGQYQKNAGLSARELMQVMDDVNGKLTRPSMEAYAAAEKQREAEREQRRLAAEEVLRKEKAERDALRSRLEAERQADTAERKKAREDVYQAVDDNRFGNLVPTPGTTKGRGTMTVQQAKDALWVMAAAIAMEDLTAGQFVTEKDKEKTGLSEQALQRLEAIDPHDLDAADKRREAELTIARGLGKLTKFVRERIDSIEDFKPTDLLKEENRDILQVSSIMDKMATDLNRYIEEDRQLQDPDLGVVLDGKTITITTASGLARQLTDPINNVAQSVVRDSAERYISQRLSSVIEAKMADMAYSDVQKDHANRNNSNSENLQKVDASQIANKADGLSWMPGTALSDLSFQISGSPQQKEYFTLLADSGRLSDLIDVTVTKNKQTGRLEVAADFKKLDNLLKDYEKEHPTPIVEDQSKKKEETPSEDMEVAPILGQPLQPKPEQKKDPENLGDAPLQGEQPLKEEDKPRKQEQAADLDMAPVIPTKANPEMPQTREGGEAEEPKREEPEKKDLEQDDLRQSRIVADNEHPPIPVPKTPEEPEIKEPEIKEPEPRLVQTKDGAEIEEPKQEEPKREELEKDDLRQSRIIVDNEHPPVPVPKTPKEPETTRQSLFNTAKEMRETASWKALNLDDGKVLDQFYDKSLNTGSEVFNRGGVNGAWAVGMASYVIENSKTMFRDLDANKDKVLADVMSMVDKSSMNRKAGSIQQDGNVHEMLIGGMQRMNKYMESKFRTMRDFSVENLSKPENRELAKVVAVSQKMQKVMESLTKNNRALPPNSPRLNAWNETLHNAKRFTEPLQTVYDSVHFGKVDKNNIQKVTAEAICGKGLSELLQKRMDHAVEKINEKLGNQYRGEKSRVAPSVRSLVHERDMDKLRFAAEAMANRKDTKELLKRVLNDPVLKEKFDQIVKSGSLADKLGVKITVDNARDLAQVDVDFDPLRQELGLPSQKKELEDMKRQREQAVERRREQLLDKGVQQVNKLEDIRAKVAAQSGINAERIRGYKDAFVGFDTRMEPVKAGLKQMADQVSLLKDDKAMEAVYFANGITSEGIDKMESLLTNPGAHTNMMDITRRDLWSLVPGSNFMDPDQSRKSISGNMVSAAGELSSLLEKNLAGKELTMAELTKPENQKLLQAGTMLRTVTDALNTWANPRNKDHIQLSKEDQQALSRATNLGRVMEILTPQEKQGTIHSGSKREELLDAANKAVLRASLQAYLKEAGSKPGNEKKSIGELVTKETLNRLEYLAWAATHDETKTMGKKLAELAGSDQRNDARLDREKRSFVQLANNDLLGDTMGVRITLDDQMRPTVLDYNVEQFDEMLDNPDPVMEREQDEPVLNNDYDGPALG